LRGATPPVERGEDAFRRMKADDQRAILGPGKYAAWRSGALGLDDLVARTRDARWGPGLRERGLREVRAMQQAAD
jgi:hypothetical protein